ncbi:hypothetical protein PAXINDRAFT_16731 [Paxillus involutus ATCC 200175]|uniref:Uncharacterized protein n=1 Tax=Paxillus involutus ATCC 200175 TaxID=664439 RepID=A0A0C9TR42_PAXIN|nr:hypothetical protein PAXINDRAFT_16731 [Paxillus involutus ATCC 200175]
MNKKITRSSAQNLNSTRTEETENYQVKDAESGLSYLENKLLCIVGEPVIPEHLITTILNITQLKNVPRPVIEALRAVAYLIEEQEALKMATAIATHIKEKTSGEITSHVITAITPHMASMLITAEHLDTNTKNMENILEAHQHAPTDIDNKLERIENAADAILSSFEDIKDAISLLSPSLDSTQNSINTLITKATEQATTSYHTN